MGKFIKLHYYTKTGKAFSYYVAIDKIVRIEDGAVVTVEDAESLTCVETADEIMEMIEDELEDDEEEGKETEIAKENKNSGEK